MVLIPVFFIFLFQTFLLSGIELFDGFVDSIEFIYELLVCERVYEGCIHKIRGHSLW